MTTLTPRQREIAGLVATGKSNKAIGDALSIKEDTVKIMLSRIYRKAQIYNRTELAVLVASAEIAAQVRGSQPKCR